VQPCGGAREAELFSDRNEVAKVPKFHGVLGVQAQRSDYNTADEHNPSHTSPNDTCVPGWFELTSKQLDCEPALPFETPFRAEARTALDVGAVRAAYRAPGQSAKPSAPANLRAL
jgi:hypothetical protein